MLKIDVQSMKNHAEKLAKLVEQYEENTMILSREIQNSDTEWHDDNTETFFNKMEKQKGELKEFISNMNEVSTTYETIVDKTQGLFWWNGAVYYIIFFSLELIEIALLIKQYFHNLYN